MLKRMPSSKHRPTVPAAWFLALAIGVVGCTGDSADPGSPPAAGPANSVDDASAGPLGADAPLVVHVHKLKGELAKPRRRKAAASIGRAIDAWLTEGFTAGPYPRDDFDAAFASFTTRAARSAKDEREQLTNIELGPHLVDVSARRRTASLSLVAADAHAQGASARVRLSLTCARDDASVLNLDLRADLYLTPRTSGRWRIFAFDVSRSVRGSR